MSRFFDDLERELVRAARAQAAAARRARRRPRALALPLAAALTLAVAGTAAAATYLALRSSSIAPFSAEDVAPEQRVAPGTSRVVELRAADPDRRALPWALRVSRSDAGLLCTTVGQVRGEEFGLVGLDGRFRAIPEANADACGDEGAMAGARAFAARRTREVRTVVNGVAGDEVERVTVAASGRSPREVPHTPEGAFLHVLRGYPEDVQPVLTLERRDGSRRRYAFARSELVRPDPLGGRAWRIEAIGFGAPRPRARLRPGCVTFATARPVPGERNVRAPAVCGLEPNRPDVPNRSLYFAARRLSGDRELGRDVWIRGDWNDHPARTVVYGSARGHRRIVVTAPGTRTVTAPSPNGGFLVLLPPRVAPASVSVEVDGRRYGPRFGTIAPRRWR
ncbi:MAG TPA: hypothetical protein VGW75_15930 [Solirubrobacteraceae bacterium]|nr:hypothetical protein [Solirubrobacteraceae bacterium]